MSTNMIVVAGIVERLLHLFSSANPQKNDPIAGVNHELRFIQAALEQVIENTDANDDLDDAIDGKSLLSLLYNFEDAVESYMFEFKSRRNRFMNGTSTQKKVLGKFCKEISLEMNRSYYSIHALIQTAGGMKKGDKAAVIKSESTAIVRMEDVEKDLVSALTEGTKHLNLVSVCGMVGIGKTTLARKIYNDPEIESRFPIRVWISVSQEWEMKDILQKIHSEMRLCHVDESKNLPRGKLEADIYEHLKGRQYLIFLDDMWDADAWFISLRMVFPDNETGSRILITTELKDAEFRVRGPRSHIHIMRTLTDEESQKLLRHNLSGAGVDNFGDKITCASGGLPLAIVALASSVSKEPSQQWKWHLEQFYGRVCSPMFYKNLPIHLRVCLLYLATYFPEDEEVEMDTACQLLIAEGLVLIGDIRNGEKMMDVAALYLEELDNRSLVQIQEEDIPGKRRFKSCRIHKVIGDFCKNRGKKHGIFGAIDLGDVNDQSMSRADRLAIFLNEYECSYDFLNEKSDYLRSLSLFNSSRCGEGYIRPREIPSLENFIRLRILYLYAVDLKEQKLPKEMEKLVHLRYLSLRECYLKELCRSSISKMFYLQTLDLRVRKECQIIIQDQDVLEGLKRLRYLYLPLAYQTPNGKKLHLGKLEDLELLDNFNTNVCNVDDLQKCTNLIWLTVTITGDFSGIDKILTFISNERSQLRSTSLNLRDFDCYSRERISAIENVFNSTAIRSLGIEGYLKKLPTFDRTNSKLTEIVLNGSELVEDPMKILRELPSLRILVLEIEAYSGTKMKCFSPGFPELRYLKLSKLYNLEDWQVGKKAMPNLCTLVIENCSNLQKLPEVLLFSGNLRELESVSMPDEFVGRIQNSYETGGDYLNKMRNVQPNVKVNGRPLMLKERQQAGPGDP